MAKFEVGHPKPPGSGRKPGQKNRATVEMRKLWEEFLESAEYQDSLKRRIKSGRAERVEQLLYHYVYGKPVDTVELSGQGGGPIKLTGVFTQEVIAAAEEARRDRASKEHKGGNGNGGGHS